MNYDARIDAPEAAPAPAFDPLLDKDEDAVGSRWRTVLIALGVLLAMVLLWFLLHGSEGEDALATDRSAQAPVVTVTAPGRTTVEGTITSTGTVDARRELPVGIAGEGGQVISVLVDAGEWVNQGEVLAVIDRSVQTQQAAGQAAQVQVAEADARLAQSNLERALRLVERGFVSKADVDRLTATRDAATARVRVARAQLGELQARTRRLNVVAPAPGLVLERNIEPGQVVSSGSGVLFRLARGGEMEMLARLSESDLTAIAPGVSAQVTPVGSSRSFTGQVWQVSPVIDPQTRQGTARIALAYAPELRPGGFASAVIKSGTSVAPVLPESAILSDAQGSYVYIVGRDNKVARRAIKSGAIGANGVSIVSGLSGNERVVVRAGAFLAPGETVKPQAAPK